MLRASSQQNDETVDVSAVMDGNVVSGIEHGRELVAFAEAVVARDTSAITLARDGLVGVAGVPVMVDAAGVISNFQRMVRIADATGIGLGSFEAPTAELRESLGIETFRHHD
jgi:hypothetical protein